MITESICKEWLSTPDINPITKRRIKVTKTGVYAKLLKSCAIYNLDPQPVRVVTVDPKITKQQCNALVANPTNQEPY